MGWKSAIFSFVPGALFYQAVTCQALWRLQVESMVHYVRGEPLRVLDLGCGAGVSTFALARQLPTSTIEGIDLSEPLLAGARQAAGTKFADVADRIVFRHGDATALPYEDASFDLVTGHSFLYLVDDPDAVLREARRVLAPGGQILLMEPSQEGGLHGALGEGRSLADMLLQRPMDALRFAFAVVHWRMLARIVGTVSRTKATRWLTDAGYDDVALEPTLAGMGWHVAARVPE